MNKIAITMGDPNGIGPEIILKYIEKIKNISDIYIIIGKKSALEYFGKQLDSNELEEIISIEDISKIDKPGIYLFDIKTEEFQVNPGEIDKKSGKISMLCVEKAVDFVMNNFVDAIVTCPISKEAINLAGYRYSGHTEYLAERSSTENYGMVLKGNKITVVLNSTHLSIKDAVDKVKKENILKKILLADEAKKKLGINTKIAVAGLNPHNGENGLFGDEEEKEIIPAIREAKKLGIDVEGPIVPDSLFVKMLKNRYNISVVMYHDQGLIPMKMESFGKGVNITFGLSFIRTSVDHGTGFDIAGKGIADEGSLKEAIKCAKLIIENK